MRCFLQNCFMPSRSGLMAKRRSLEIIGMITFVFLLKQFVLDDPRVNLRLVKVIVAIRLRSVIFPRNCGPCLCHDIKPSL